MAVTLTVTAGSSAEEFSRTTRRREYVIITGASAAANDTSAAYTCKFLTAPARVEGGAIVGAVSGRAVTFTALTALGDSSVGVWISE
jgi:hypothetical protein